MYCEHEDYEDSLDISEFRVQPVVLQLLFLVNEADPTGILTSGNKCGVIYMYINLIISLDS